MGGRGNKRNNSKKFYNSSNNGGRNAPYDNRPMSQPAHPSQPPSNYSLGRGNGNFQSRPYWQNPFTNTVGYSQQPSWVHQTPINDPPWGRNNYRPQHPGSWDQTQHHQFPNQRNPKNPGPLVPALSVASPNSTFRFDQMPLGVPPPPTPLLFCTIPNPSPNDEPSTAPKKDSLALSVITPPLGSKEDREMRLEVAKTLVKKSLEESTFRFGQVPLGVPPPLAPPPLLYPVPNASHNDEPITAPTKGSSTLSVITPPLGSKEDRELRLEVAKTLVKKSLEESKGEEFCKSTSPTLYSAGLIKKKCLKPKSTKPNEGESDCYQIISLPVDRVSDNESFKSGSSMPGSDEQCKRRLSLESNYFLSSDASKSTSKPVIPKRNRSNSLSQSSIPKTTETSTPSEAQNIKQRIIHELLGMSKITLKEIISNPRSRKFEHVMKYMMKESRWKQSQIQRQAAQAGIDSPFESQNCELVQRDYEDLLSDPDLAINLSNLPTEMIETLGNIFNLGAVSGERNSIPEDMHLGANEISCLFDSFSPSYPKLIPYVDLSSPVSICIDAKTSAEDEGTLEDCAKVPTHSDQDLESDEISNILVMESIKTEESSHLCKSLEPSPDLLVNKSTTFSPLVDGPEKQIPSNDFIAVESKGAEDVLLRPSRPVTDDFPIPLSREERESIEEATINELNHSQTKLDNQNVPLEEEDCALPSTLAVDVGNRADKYEELQTTSAIDETSITNKDPMFSTQSDSPTIDEELNSCSSRTKKDSENNLDTEDRDNIQLETEEPLLSPDPFNAGNINNNDMMAMKAINTVEPEESVDFLGAFEKDADQCTNQACPANSGERESTSTQDLDCKANEIFEILDKNASNNDPTACVVRSVRSKSISQKNEMGGQEPIENNLVSFQISSCTENPTVLEMQKEEDTPMEIQEPSVSSKGIEIGIQTDATADDSCFIVNANDMGSIVKLLESSSLPGITNIKHLLSHSSSHPPVPTDKSDSSTKNLEKGNSEAAGDLDFFQSSLLTQPTNSRNPDENISRTSPVVICKPSHAVTNRHSRTKRQRCASVTDSDRPASTDGILKNLQNQIKGLEPKDKLKYVFLKITDIEKKIAEWADIKKELYQLVSYILEDEKSQSASSSHEESVTKEIEPEPNKNLKRLSAKPSLPRPSQTRPSRLNDSRMPVLVEAVSDCGSTSNSPPKNSPRIKRRRAFLTSRKKKKKTSNRVLAGEKEAFVTPRNVSLRHTRSVGKIKIERSSDNEDSPVDCSSIGERSRSSKRNKSSVSTCDSTPPPGPTTKRACKRQSSSNIDTLPTQTNTASPLRKTKAELKQMVFFPKPPEKITRQASVSKTLSEDGELRVTRSGRNVVKEEISECVTESNEVQVPRLRRTVPLRDCSVVLQQLGQCKLQSKQTGMTDESAVDSQSVTSSDDDDELPLSLISRKLNVSSPTASFQGDIDISSVSSSDTISLKLNIPCPKSMKNQMKKYGEQADGSRHHHHHSSRHGPLVFAQHNQGTILDIKVVGKHVLAAAEDGVVLSFSVKSGKLKKKYRGHSAAVTCICIINSESEPYYPERMITGSADGQVRNFILKTAEQMHAPLQVGETTAIDSDWGVIYLGTIKGEIVQVNTKTFTSIGEIFECSQEPIHALKATKEGPRKVLIVGSRNQAITVRDAETGLLLRSVSGGWQSTVYSLLLDNSLVYCGTKEGTVPAFDFTNGQQMFCLQAGNGVRCLKAYNGLLFAGCYDGFIYVFKGQTLVTKFAGGKMIISMDFTKNKVIFSSKDMLQALNFPCEVSALLKEMKMKKVL